MVILIIHELNLIEYKTSNVEKTSMSIFQVEIFVQFMTMTYLEKSLYLFRLNPNKYFKVQFQLD